MLKVDASVQESAKESLSTVKMTDETSSVAPSDAMMLELGMVRSMGKRLMANCLELSSAVTLFVRQ